MDKMISASLLSLFLMTTPSLAAMPATADKADAPMNVDKASFVKVVTSSNAFEIESSKLAEEKAKGADVKEFAAAMIKITPWWPTS
ncbi:putative outer membrane protein [Rhizobium azooxidifex]|uniref:Putative outer membrane protein n=1 Tax=Mycoplana azooxidifex TaxID=1636188 RepID=A0A7W6GNQ3_9HYPH|nr:putative outer membrane protein [Mycoplana azooxidifex]